MTGVGGGHASFLAKVHYHPHRYPLLVNTMATIVHFDVPADDLERAKAFYAFLFGWTFEQPPGFPDYYLISTTGTDGSPGVGGGMGKRGAPGQRMSNVFGVVSIDASLEEVVRLGGRVTQSKMTVPGFGYMALCEDTEGNSFGLWEEDAGAK